MSYLTRKNYQYIDTYDKSEEEINFPTDISDKDSSV